MNKESPGQCGSVGWRVVWKTERSQVQFLIRAHAWVADSIPVRVCARGNRFMFLSQIAVCLPPIPSL